jgi:hypothetical protein
MSGIGDILPVALSAAMLAAFALSAGGIWMIVKRGERRHGLLMVAVALVLLLNVLIWALPAPRL